jgi:hypothetical protein
VDQRGRVQGSGALRERVARKSVGVGFLGVDRVVAGEGESSCFVRGGVEQ